MKCEKSLSLLGLSEAGAAGLPDLALTGMGLVTVRWVSSE